jgi:hypothetical protein
MARRSRMNGAENVGNLPADDSLEISGDDHEGDEGNGQAQRPKPLVGCAPASADEVEDLLADLRELENARVSAERVRGLTSESLGCVPAADFDLWRCLSEWGAGQYRITARVGGERPVRFRRMVTVAGKPGAGNAPAASFNGSPDTRSPVAAQPAAFVLPQMQYPGQQYPGQPIILQTPAPQAPATENMPMQAMFQLMIGQSKQQSDLLIALLAQRVEQQNKPQMVSELGELLSLAERLAGKKRSLTASDDDDDDDGFLASGAKAFFSAMMENAKNNQITSPASNAASLSAAATQPAPIVPQAASPSAATSSPPRPRPRVVTNKQKSTPQEKRVKLVVRMLLEVVDDADRDAAATAGTVASIMKEDAVQLVEQTPPGFVTQWLLDQWAELSPHAEFVSAVESELRKLYTDEADEAQAATAAAADAAAESSST